MAKAPPRLLALITVCGTLTVVAISASVALALFTAAASVPGNAFDTDTLDPPTGLTATGGASVDLSWTATPDTYASGHRVLRATTSGGPYNQIAEVTPRTTTTYTDSPAAGTYYYVVRAFYQNWESGNSNQASASVSEPVTVNFGASGDSYVKAKDPNKNKGDRDTIRVYGKNDDVRRSFLQFDLSSIPAGSSINSATLTLCFTEIRSEAIGRVHELRVVSASWNESSITWNNQPSVSGSITATITVPSSLVCVDWTVTADVQAWVNGGANYGWRINDQDESTAGDFKTKYASREHSTASLRPTLEVTYTPP